ncbi:MAG: hypothetical protein WD205_07000 [Rhodothermales bacterium]
MAKIKAVEMVRRIREAHHEQLEGKTWDEQVAFYKEHACALHEKLDLPRGVEKEGHQRKDGITRQGGPAR